jgi:erythromycin esterase-like protein
MNSPLLKTLFTVALGLLASVARAAAPNCGTEPQLQLDHITERVILVGETHGNEQSPAFVARLVCGLLALDRPVILALERISLEQLALDRYLASPGRADDVRALLREHDWAAPTQDGRSSAAMLKLLEQVRRWRHAGLPVELIAMVQPWRPDAATSAPASDPKRVQAREDRGMADTVTAALARHPKHSAVVLAGSFHTVIGSKIHQDIIGAPSMGEVLATRTAVHVIGLSSDAGSSWNCGTSCGPNPLLAAPWDLPDARIDTRVSLGEISVSPPAAAVR